MNDHDHRLIVGCMTGTSIDAIDAALVHVEGRGLGMRARFIAGVTRSLSALAPTLRALADQRPAAAADIARTARDVSIAHARAVRELLDQAPLDQLPPPSLIAVHGQTVVHAPPLSWQLFNPWPIAHELRIPVVFDLRGADLAAGGQGAPITPIADWILLRAPERRAIVNLGGFCNITILPPDSGASPPPLDELRGFDVCACNHLLDALARDLLHQPFDLDGRVAASGVPVPDALADLQTLLARQSASRRSLGTGDEALDWIRRWRDRAPAPNLAATMTAAIAHAVAAHLGAADRVLLAGGGARNRALAGAIARASRAPVQPLDSVALPAEFREAAEMAVLGALCQDRVPITLPAITGCAAPAPISGCFTAPQ